MCFCSKLEAKLGEYILDTLRHIETVKMFCVEEPEWTLLRKRELERIRSIKDQANGQLDPERELGRVMNNTLDGLEELQPFLDAVEKLAVTSMFVFKNSDLMPEGVSHENVLLAIATAKSVSSLLIHFKRDANAFFQPSLSNLDVLDFQLDKYIEMTQLMYEKMSKSLNHATPNRRERHKSTNTRGGKPK